MVVSGSILPPLHQGLLLPRSILWPPLTTESLVDPPFLAPLLSSSFIGLLLLPTVCISSSQPLSLPSRFFCSSRPALGSLIFWSSPWFAGPAAHLAFQKLSSCTWHPPCCRGGGQSGPTRQTCLRLVEQDCPGALHHGKKHFCQTLRSTRPPQRRTPHTTGCNLWTRASIKMIWSDLNWFSPIKIRFSLI